MLFKLLGLPLTLPVAGIRFCLEQVRNAAEAELTDPEPVKQELLELQLKLEEGEITEEEYLPREAALMQRLRAIRAYRQQLAQVRAAAGAGSAGDGGSGGSGEGGAGGAGARRVVVEFNADPPLR
jgi:hypothetical protein